MTGRLYPLDKGSITIIQEWFESEDSKTGWDSFGWTYEDGTPLTPEDANKGMALIEMDKFGNFTKACISKGTTGSLK